MGIDLGNDITEDDEFQDSMRDFVKKHIKHRTCSRIVAKPGKDRCCCGRSLEDHDDFEGESDKSAVKWTPENDTTTIDATTYGMIAFHGFGRELTYNVPYVRVDENMRHNELGNIMTLLSHIWKIPAPHMVVSVTGGAKQFFMKNRLKSTFKRGLINVATSSGAWIITGGTGTGVMQFVGEAVKEYQLSSGGSKGQVVALGIATWGIVDNKSALEGSNTNGCFPSHYSAKHLAYGDFSAPLDPNHTHFILVDDGTENNFGKEIEFRAGLENHISSRKISGRKGRNEVKVPVVLLVLEGGVNTLKTVLEALRKKTPVVVIQGSGRAADFIAMAYKENRHRDGNNPIIIDEPVQRERALGLYDSANMQETKREKEVNNCLDYLRDILDAEYSDLVNIFHIDDVDTTKEIDEAILYALLKAGRSNAQSQLDLAILWNRWDVARQKIFESGNPEKFKSLDLYNAMMNALVANSADFVQLFLEHGVNLEVFLTRERLKHLYNRVLEDPNIGESLFRRTMKEAERAIGISCVSLQKGSLEWDHDNTLTIVGIVIKDFLEETGDNIYGTSKDSSLKNPERDLFLWAVLLNRQELAKLFWRMGKDHIGAALTASQILARRGYNASNDEEVDLSQELYQSASEWEDIATGVMNECYLSDKELAHKLLVRQVPTWWDRTVFAMADAGEKLQFMGHSCCQTKLNHIWRGKMTLYTSMWKIWLCMFLPMFLPVIRFHYDDVNATLQKKTQSKKTDLIEMEKLEGRTMLNGTNEIVDEISPVKSACASLKEFFEHVYYFHAAPVTKFYYHVVSIVVFLSLFSFFLLTDLRPIDTNKPSVYEFIVWAWAGTFIIEEFRQLGTKDPKTITRKLAVYFKSLWNIFDTMIHAFFFISIILRLTLTGNDFGWARIFYSVTLVLYYLRTLQLFYVLRDTGPKVIMIRRMLTDLAFLGAIMLTVITGYGVAVQNLRHPNANASVSLFVNVFHQPFFNIYGELFLEDFEGDPGTCDPSTGGPNCSEESWLAVFLFACYMIFTNTLLLNLLIAMFSFTFQTVQENSEIVWRYHRYSLIFEYYDKPTLAAPLTFFTLIWRAVKSMLRMCACRQTPNTDFRKKMSKMDNRILTAFEKAGMETYLLKMNKSSKEHIEAKVSSTSERIDKVIEELEDIKDRIAIQQTGSELDLTLLRTGFPSPPGPGSTDVAAVNNRIGNLESQLRKQGNTLNQVDEAMGKVTSYIRNLQTTETGSTATTAQPESADSTGEMPQRAALLADITKVHSQLSQLMKKLQATEDAIPGQPGSW